MARKPTDPVKLQLRFHEALRRRLAQEAKKHDRSLNAEIIQRLEQSFREQDQKQLMTSIAQESAREAAQTTLTILEGRFKPVVPARRIEAQPEPADPVDTNQKGKAR
jgi:ATP-dependent helicase/DNAse subunit B